MRQHSAERAARCWCGGERGPRVPADADGWGCLENIGHARIAEKDVPCVCHGPDRPHAPHQPCDKGCQPDWHLDDCAIYLPATSVTSPGGSDA